MRTIWIIIVLAVACSAEAGPWLRPDGEGFMSADSIGSIGRDQGDLQLYSGVFVEYGVREDLTLGLTGGLNQNQDGNVTLYFRKPIQAAGTWIMAYDIGLGTDFGGPPEPHLRLGFSVGRGGLFRDQSGWAHIDTYLKVKAGSASDLKIEATLGKRGAKDWLYMMQFFASRLSSGSWRYEAAPSVAIPMRSNRHLQLGLSAANQNGGRYGLKFAIWREF